MLAVEYLFHWYSVSTNFCLEVIEPSARKVFNFWTLDEREEQGGGGASEERSKHGKAIYRVF